MTIVSAFHSCLSTPLSRMHLTNFAVNKHSKDFDDDEDEGTGSKRSLVAVLDMLEQVIADALKHPHTMEHPHCTLLAWASDASDVSRATAQVGENAAAVWADIASICIKTIIAIAPTLVQKYHGYFMIPQDSGKAQKALGTPAPPPMPHSVCCGVATVLLGR